MNKPTLLITIIIVGFIPTGAFADTVLTALDNADFFYSVVNQDTVVEQSKPLSVSTERQAQSIELSAADFFYGVNIDKDLNIRSKAVGRDKEVDVAASKDAQLSPGTFYGYTEPVLDKEKCANC